MKIGRFNIPLEKVIHWLVTLTVAVLSGAHVVKDGTYLVGNAYEVVVTDMAKTLDGADVKEKD